MVAKQKDSLAVKGAVVRHSEHEVRPGCYSSVDQSML